jgi:hypothetical protein
MAIICDDGAPRELHRADPADAVASEQHNASDDPDREQRVIGNRHRSDKPTPGGLRTW